MVKYERDQDYVKLSLKLPWWVKTIIRATGAVGS